MATVNKLLRDLAELEDQTRSAIAGDSTDDVRHAVRTGYAVAVVAATHAVLDLSVKGVIPEGSGGRVMAALKQAMEESRDRVTA